MGSSSLTLQSAIRETTRVGNARARLARLMKILEILSTKPATVRVERVDLAAACGTSVHTIRRDMEILNAGEAWTHYDHATRSYSLLITRREFPIPGWTPGDTMVIALARSLLGSPDTHLGVEIKQAFDKVTQPPSPELRQLMDDAAGVALRGVTAPPPETRRKRVRSTRHDFRSH
ncbi:MAG: DeoR family transcriptional regulator [Capsulimonadaceae bacterium]